MSQKRIIENQYVKTCPTELPENFLKWADSLLPNDNTILYRKGNRKGFCYTCGQEVTAVMDKFKQGYYSQCPYCGTRSVCFLESGTSWKVDNIFNVSAIQKGEDGTIWIRQWHIKRNYRVVGITKENFVEIARYCLTNDEKPVAAKWIHEMKDNWFGHHDYYWMDDWVRDKRIVYVYDGNDYFFIPDDIKDIVRGTCLEYLQFDNISKYIDSKYQSIIRLMLDFGRYPAFEKLANAGYRQLIGAKLSYSDERCVNWSADTIQKALKLPLWMLKERSPEEWDNKNLKSAQQAYKLYQQGKISKEEIKKLLECGYSIDMFGSSFGHAPLMKIIEYIDQNLRNEEGVIPYGKIRSFQITYTDYLEMAQRCEMDLNNKRVLFPKDLNKEHNKLLNRIKASENKELSKKITQASKKLEKYGFKSSKYIIRPARTWKELYEEGKANNHCVETYSKRVANGETAIFFVRKVDNPDQTYYTLELRDKRVVQCRTKHNASYVDDQEVKDFVDLWYSKKVVKGVVANV